MELCKDLLHNSPENFGNNPKLISSTRASTCSLQIYYRSPEEWLYLLLLDLSQKAFVNDQTHPQHLMQGNDSSSGRAQKAILRRSKSMKTDGQEEICFRP